MQNTGNRARVIEEHVVRSVGQADKILMSLRAAYEKKPEQLDSESVGVYLDSLVLQIAVMGPDGYLKVSSTAPPSDTRIDLSDEERFRAHLNSDRDDLFISKPVVGRNSGKASIQLSRRISNPDGTFAGIILASIDQGTLAQFYDFDRRRARRKHLASGSGRNSPCHPRQQIFHAGVFREKSAVPENRAGQYRFLSEPRHFRSGRQATDFLSQDRSASSDRRGRAVTK